jgi:hypothetical protein
MAFVAIVNLCLTCTSTIPKSLSIFATSTNSLEMFVDSRQRDVASDEHEAKQQRTEVHGKGKFFF